MALTVYLSDGTTQVGYGASNKVTSGSLSRWIELDWGALNREQFGHPKPYGSGWVRTGEAWTEPNIITGAVWSLWAASNAERNLMDEVNEDLPLLFNPNGDTWDLRVDRTESGGGTNSRILTVETVQIPGAFNVGDIHIVDSSYGWARWPFTLQAAHPFWRDRTATTQAVSVTNKNTTETNTVSWTQIDNTGFEVCGLKIALSNVTATTTSITISNTSTSQTVVWTDTLFANGDELDFFVDDPQVVDWTSGGSLSATSDMSLRRGTNDGTIYGQGSGSPSFTATLSYRFFWRGP